MTETQRKEPVAHRLEFAPPAGADQRHPGHHAHRGGPDAAHPDAVSRFPELVDEVMSELEPIIKRSNLVVVARMAGKLPDAAERPPEGEADRPESAQQRAEIHAVRGGDDQGPIRRRGADWSRSPSPIPVSESRRKIRRRCSKTSGSSTAHRRAGTGAPASACRSAGGSRLCWRARSNWNSEVGRGSTFVLGLPVRLRRR